MNESADVIIIGGGFTGSALAHALSDGKRRIVVYEARRTPAHRFAGELLHPGRLSVLGHALTGRLRARGADVGGFAVVPGPGQPATLLPYEGQPGLGIEHAVLVDELRLAAAEQPGVEFRYGLRAEARLVDGQVRGVRASDGSELDAPVVFGSEGRHSRLRSQLGLPTETQLVSFTAALRVDGGQLPHPGFGHVLLGGPGPILAYPITPTSVRMCFDLPAGDEVQAAGLAALLARDYAPYVPAPLRAAMLSSLEHEAPQLVANHAIRTGRCVAPGAALVGDAGGCAHPLTAAGMSVCLNDIGLLREELAVLGAQHTVDNALARFEARRYRFVRVRETLTDGLYRLLEHRGASGPALRQALFAHWKRDRSRSVALLSCRSSNANALRSEWIRVALRALGVVAAGGSGPRRPALSDLASFVGVQLPRLLRA